MKSWNWKGILGAWVIDTVGSMIMGVVAAIPVVIYLVMRGTSAAAIPLALATSSVFLALALISGLAVDVFAGYLAAKWAPRNPLAHALVLGGLLMLSGLLLGADASMPLWFRLGSWLAAPAAALGGWLFVRYGKPSSVTPATIDRPDSASAPIAAP